MRRIRNQDFLPRISLLLQIRANHQDSGEFAVRARRWLQRDRVHSGDFDQAFAQQLQDLQRALRELLRLIRMRVRQAFTPRGNFVDARVVLHRARTERIQARIDAVVPSRDARKVANNLDLAHFGQRGRVLADRVAKQFLGVDSRNIERREFVRLLPRRRLLEDQVFVLADVRSSFLDSVFAHFDTSCATASICSRVFISVTHHSDALPSSG